MLETKRLVLRELTPEDFEGLYAILSDEDTMKHYPAPFSREKTASWIERSIKRCKADGLGMWAVILREENRLIGDCGITMQNIHARSLPELGYHIHRAYTCGGYATEAVQALCKWALSRDDVTEVEAEAESQNTAFQRVLEKAGFIRTGELGSEGERFKLSAKE